MREMNIELRDCSDGKCDNPNSHLIRIKRLQTVYNRSERALDICFYDNVKLLHLVLAVYHTDEFSTTHARFCTRASFSCFSFLRLQTSIFLIFYNNKLIAKFRQSLKT